MKGFYIEITNNLLDPKHRKAMKESVWLFMWLLDKMTSISEKGIGNVLGGKPITYEEINKELNTTRRTYINWVARLKKHKYINTKRTPQGLIFEINKAKKRFGQKAKRCAKNFSSESDEQKSDEQKSVKRCAKSDTPIHIQDKDKTSTAKKEEIPFVFKDILKMMFEDPKQHIRVMALYWKFKNIQPENRKQYEALLKRDLRSAKNLIGFSDKRIIDIMLWLENENTFKWDMNTVMKFITEDLTRISPIVSRKV